MKPGSNKDVAFRVLKEAGPGGLTIQQIMDAAKQKELKDFTDSSRGSLSSVSHHLPCLRLPTWLAWCMCVE